MGMDEFQAVLKARELVRKVNPPSIPVPVDLYAQEVGAVIRAETDLGPDEAGVKGGVKVDQCGGAKGSHLKGLESC
jgi:hypothetical protein